MVIESLAAALEREHREIDAGIDAFADGPAASRDRQPLMQAIQALRRHIYLEEELLFPPLRQAGLVAPLFVMLREHGQIWATLDGLEHQFDAGETRFVSCHQLTIQLQHHNLKEERIIYPQADHVLAAPASVQLRTFLNSGNLPTGWVPQKAAK
jgi:regulator of cell morphogenesis and NO signaling